MGLAPLTGVPLPFVSYGNSSLMVTLFAVGLILNVARGGTASAARAGDGRRRWQTARRRRRARRRAPRKEPIERCQEEPRVVVAAGGTAGHVVPAMAVADALRASGAEVTFLGTRERAEAELVPGGRLRDRLPRGARHRPPQPAARGAGRVEALRRGRRGARGCCAGAAPTSCWAAAATSPARPGWRRR